MARLFQVIEENQIRQTRDNDAAGKLVEWIEEIAGMDDAANVQCWSEICHDGECYEGGNFKVICIG